MHSIYGLMLKQTYAWVAGLAVGGFLLSLAACVAVQDRPSTVEFGKGVLPNSKFAATVNQITVMLSGPSGTDDGNFDFLLTVTNSGLGKACIGTSREKNRPIKFNGGVGLYDRTGKYALAYHHKSHELDLVGVRLGANYEKINAEIIANNPINGPNVVIPENGTVILELSGLATSYGGYGQVFCKADSSFCVGGALREYKPREQLMARASIIVHPCSYANDNVAWKAGEHATITSTLVGPFAVPDGIFFDFNGNR